MFGQLNRKGKVVVSDGTNPLGIIEDIRTDTATTIRGKRICMWTSPGVYATDQVEKRCNFLVGRLLYVSNRGKLTTRQRSKKHRSVGMVISYRAGVLEFQFWG
jgi:hypothetical protein